MSTQQLHTLITYWRASATEDFKVAKSLFLKKYYLHCLFFCHLALEKKLKGLVVQETNVTAPYTHDLRRLAELAAVKMTEEQRRLLDTFSHFNIAGRYPEEKTMLYRKYRDRKFTQQYLALTEKLIVWLEKEYQKK